MTEGIAKTITAAWEQALHHARQAFDEAMDELATAQARIAELEGAGDVGQIGDLRQELRRWPRLPRDSNTISDAERLIARSADALVVLQARIAELEAKLVGVMDAWEHDQAKAKIALDQRDTAERERDEALGTLKMVREIGLADEDGAATVESVIERVLRTSAVLGGDQTGACSAPGSREPDPSVPALSGFDPSRELLAGVLSEYDRNTCVHEETHRGGAIWTICDGCGRKWADDRGGFKPYEDPPIIAKARAFLCVSDEHPTGEDAQQPRAKPASAISEAETPGIASALAAAQARIAAMSASHNDAVKNWIRVADRLAAAERERDEARAALKDLLGEHYD